MTSLMVDVRARLEGKGNREETNDERQPKLLSPHEFAESWSHDAITLLQCTGGGHILRGKALSEFKTDRS